MENIKKITQIALNELKTAGADHAQCVITKGVSDEINIDNGEISLMRSLFDDKIALKALKDSKKGVIGINKTDKASLEQAAKECVEAALASVEDDAVSIAEFTENRDFVTGISEPDRDRFFDRMMEYIGDIKADYPKIHLEQVVADYTYCESFTANTNGVEYGHNHGSYSVSAMFSAHEGEKTTSFNMCDVSFMGLDKKIIDLGMQRTLFEQCEKELDPISLDEKFVGRAVFAPICFSDLLGSAFGNFINDVTIIDKTSPWYFSLGTKVASGSLTVTAAPLDERIVGGERVTDDGYISENYDIIRDGYLKSFSLSEYAAKKTGMDRSKNSSGCFVVGNGTKKLGDIIKEIDKGILVCRFSGGSPAINGDFSGVAKNSFLIEDGRVASALSETMISGNLADMLKNISDVSEETVCDGSGVIPWVAVDGITVS
ncbi:MAG: TldD/PmbA family protein [Oscillospiraceae bacterium]|nr:TldD/PmbA family protein [Oscillospiraceae bacterium]